MLKVFAANYILEQDNLSKEDKITLLKFVKESNYPQVETLLATGKMVGVNEASTAALAGPIADKVMGMTDISKAVDIVHKSLRHFYDKGMETGWETGLRTGKAAGKKAGLKTGAAAGIGSAVLVALLASVAYKGYKRFLSQAAKACRGKKGDDKSLCMKQFKKKGMQKQIADLAYAKKACSKSKDPKKCAVSFDKRIIKLRSKLRLV